MERHCEFQQEMLAAYLDLKKAFDSVHREGLWDLLHLRGIPARILGVGAAKPGLSHIAPS